LNHRTGSQVTNPMLARIGMRIALLIVIVTTIGCDRVTKHVATQRLSGRPTQSFLSDTVRLAYAENTGGFLNLGTSWSPSVRTAVFTVATGLVLFALIIVAFYTRLPLLRAVGLALFIAGGISNWVDRLLYGSVVDFLNVGIGGLRTGVFNVADVAIMIGAALFVLAEFRREPHRP
jgi:signal peptidase II